MRACYRTALALLLLYILQDNVLGAPPRARYMWIKCNPNNRDPNCVQYKGPWMNYPGPSDRLAPSAAKDMVSVESSGNNPETETEELSGDSSGDHSEQNDGWMNDGLTTADPQVEEEASGEKEASGEEEASGANYIFPERLEPTLSAEDLKTDNMIQ